MGVKISGVGAYLPQTVVTREQAIKRRGDLDRYGSIPADYFEIPDRVYHAGCDESSSFMGSEACRRAIDNAGLSTRDIDLVICFSVVNDNIYPKDGQAIVKLAGLNRATALDIDLACGSFQSLLKVGAAFINQGMNKKVALVCTANWVHRAIDKSQDYSPLGDGAAAVILEHCAADSLLGIREQREERFFDFVKMGCANRSGSPQTIQFTFTDEFKHFIKTRATNVARELMVECKLMPADIDWLICHQVGEKAVRGWCRSLELDEKKILSTYMHTGNCMASNMPLVLDHYINKKPGIKRGDTILFYSLSMGYHASAMLWRY